MCRGKGAGGRRCPGCQAPEARAAHNRRRRENRALKAEIVDLAQERGEPLEVVEQLRAKPPVHAKAWAREHGLSERFWPGREPELGSGADPGVDVPQKGAERPSWAGEGWATEQLVGQVAAVQQLQGDHRDERALLSGSAVTTVSAPGGTNETNRVVLDNGMVGYHKPFSGLHHKLATAFGQDSAQQPVHEAAAWQLAKQLGGPWEEMVPPCVVREVEGRPGSLGLERPGIPIGHRGVEDYPEWRAAAFFDAVIGQQDRHGGNALVSGDRMYLIDHGYTFAHSYDYVNASKLKGKRVQDDPALTDSEKSALRRLVASPTLLGLTQMLEPSRAEAVRQRAEAFLSAGSLDAR